MLLMSTNTIRFCGQSTKLATFLLEKAPYPQLCTVGTCCFNTLPVINGCSVLAHLYESTGKAICSSHQGVGIGVGGSGWK